MELAKMWLGIRAMICRWHHANCFVSHTLQFVGGHLWGIRKPTSDDRFFCLRRKKWAVSTDVGCIQWRVAVSEPTVDTRWCLSHRLVAEDGEHAGRLDVLVAGLGFTEGAWSSNSTVADTEWRRVTSALKRLAFGSVAPVTLAALKFCSRLASRWNSWMMMMMMMMTSTKSIVTTGTDFLGTVNVSHLKNGP